MSRHQLDICNQTGIGTGDMGRLVLVLRTSKRELAAACQRAVVCNLQRTERLGAAVQINRTACHGQELGVAEPAVLIKRHGSAGHVRLAVVGILFLAADSNVAARKSNRALRRSVVDNGGRKRFIGR